MSSFSNQQLTTGALTYTTSQVSSCDPLTDLPGTSILLFPCGLIANSYFNDTISLVGGPANLTETGIAWASDVKRFKAPNAADLAVALQNKTLASPLNNTFPPLTNEHVMVWFRVAALPTFRKLYGSLPNGAAAGVPMRFEINDVYPVSSFMGTKSLVVTTLSSIGGKNAFLGTAYLVVGFIALGLAALFGLRMFFGGRKSGDITRLVWDK